MGKSRKKKAPNFETSLKKLGEIIQQLEDEEAPLEQSLKLFAEGKKLARECEKELDAAENYVRMIMEETGGELKEVPLDESDTASPPAETRKPDELPF